MWCGTYPTITLLQARVIAMNA
ncbi:hypothetical protein, partial [Kingella kingae]